MPPQPCLGCEKCRDHELKILDIDRRMDSVEKRLYQGDSRFAEIERKIDDHTRELQSFRLSIEAHTRHVEDMKQMLHEIRLIVEVFSSARGWLKTTRFIMDNAKYIAAFGLGVAAYLKWWK